jgi:hypothetical protein
MTILQPTTLQGTALQRTTRERRAGFSAGAAWRQWLPLLWLALPLLGLGALEVRAESRTAESIWSQSDAEQRAIQQIPLPDREGISHTRCQEVGVGRMGSLPRFRCTVWFEPPSPSATPATTAPAQP